MSPIRLIATDLDGTLLRSDGSLSGRVRSSLVNAHEAGIELVPATGRPRIVAKDIIAQLDFVDHWIFANGSMTWHLGRSEVIRGFWLAPDVARKLVVALRKQFPRAGFAVEFEDTFVFEPVFKRVLPIVPQFAPCDDVVTEIDRRVQKILVTDDSRHLDELYGGISDVVGGNAVPSYSGLRFVELAASLVTKASALAMLAADLGLGQADVAAFGDNHNDISMLSWAGRSFAMANATKDAKEAADTVIGHHDDDAIADQIDALVAETRC